MKTKNLFIIMAMAALLPVLSACSSKEPEKKGQSAGEVMHKYTETLSGAPGKARDAAGKEEDRSAEQKKMFDEMDKDGNK